MAVLAIVNVQGSENYPKICIENDKCTIIVFSVPNGVQLEEKAVVTDPPEEAQCWKWFGDLDHVTDKEAKTLVSESEVKHLISNPESIWRWGVLTTMVHQRWEDSGYVEGLKSNIIYVKYK